jgi:hypothetical protein
MRNRVLVLILGLAGLLLLGLLGSVAGIVRAQTPTFFPTPTLFGTPFITPTVFASPTFFIVTTAIPSPTPGCAAPLALQRGQQAFVRGGIFVRTGPSESTPYVNYYTESVTVTIVEGPICDGQLFNWWRVRGPGQDGWIAEGTPNRYFIYGSIPISECSAPGTLVVGQEARILNGVRVREQADEDALVLTVAPFDSLVQVLEGPVCADDLFWWRIRVTVVGVVYEGWAADADTGGTPLMLDEAARTASVCLRPLPLTIGGRAYVDYDDQELKNLRAAPTTRAALVASLLDGIALDVIGGPVCSEGLNWWQVRVVPRPDVTGWMAEGGNADPWLAPAR